MWGVFLSILYHSTHLEDWITNFYQKIGVIQPEDINEENIAYKLGIYLFRVEGPPHHIFISGIHAIYTDSRASPRKQKEQFFHELCHMLRHHGNQLTMPPPLREWQEHDAARFVKCATIPYQMVLSWDFNDPGIIRRAIKTFGISREVCEERLFQIKRRIDSKLLIKGGHTIENSYLHQGIYR